MNYIIVKESLAVILEVTDEQLMKIRGDRDFWLDVDFVKLCGESRGDNAVIILLICKNGVQEILEGLEILRKHYKSVSFWNREHKRYYQRGRMRYDPISKRKA